MVVEVTGLNNNALDFSKVLPSVSAFIQPSRPWLSLYGVHIKPAHRNADLESASEIQRKVPDEIMLMILGKLEGYTLGRVACTCRHWKILTESPKLWEPICRSALASCRLDATTLCTLFANEFRYSWKRMFILYPHVRFDGLYVARNTYVKVGVVEFNNRKPVHLVSYFRYIRFFEDGTLLYRTSPMILSKVYKTMTKQQGNKGKLIDTVFHGRYEIKGTTVRIAVSYGNSRSTEMSSRLTLRSTHPGAHNRLDINTLSTRDRAEEEEAAQGLGDQLGPEVGGMEHRRGCAPYVFVTWEDVVDSQLNLPVQEMDFFVPG